ncbi:MAG: tRNA (adenosine(37)-N6)-dimethylallyltransferase MiaA [Bacteroidota bacterium]
MPAISPAAQGKYLLVVLGPTAVGKTALAIKLAHYFGTEIVSADSRQFFKELKIGTAIPLATELEMVAHHFIGNLTIQDSYNVSRFETEALAVIDRILSKKNVAILVGGSGLYINAVCQGIDEMPDADAPLRAQLNADFEQFGIEPLREKLKLLDPLYYSKTDMANHKRIIRALEVCLATGRPYSSFMTHQAKARNFIPIKIGIKREREELNARINRRVDLMIEQGLVAEAHQFLPLRHLNSLQTVGYRELFSYFDGKYTLDEAIDKIKVNSRRYAKKQMTWFAREKEINWFDAAETNKIIDWVKTQLL